MTVASPLGTIAFLLVLPDQAHAPATSHFPRTTDGCGGDFAAGFVSGGLEFHTQLVHIKRAKRRHAVPYPALAMPGIAQKTGRRLPTSVRANSDQVLASHFPQPREKYASLQDLLGCN